MIENAMRNWFCVPFVLLSTHSECLPSPALVQWGPQGSRFCWATQRETERKRVSESDRVSERLTHYSNLAGETPETNCCLNTYCVYKEYLPVLDLHSH